MSFPIICGNFPPSMHLPLCTWVNCHSSTPLRTWNREIKRAVLLCSRLNLLFTQQKWPRITSELCSDLPLLLRKRCVCWSPPCDTPNSSGLTTTNNLPWNTILALISMYLWQLVFIFLSFFLFPRKIHPLQSRREAEVCSIWKQICFNSKSEGVFSGQKVIFFFFFSFFQEGFDSE